MEDRSRNSSPSILAMLCVILFFATVAYGGVDITSLGVITLFTVIISLVWISRLLSHGELALNTSVLLVPIICLIAIGLVQLLPLGTSDTSGALKMAPAQSLSLDPFSTRMFVVQLVIYLIFFAAALTFINSSKIKQVISLLIVGFTGVMAFYGILQWLTKPDGIYGLRPTPQAIPFSSFVNQHHFAALMEMSIGLGLGILFGSKIRLDRTPVLLFALLIMAAAIVLTGSRGGLLSLVTVVVMVGLFSWNVRRREVGGGAEVRQNQTGSKLAIITALSMGAVVLLGLVIFLGGAESLLRGTGVGVATEDFTTGRSHYWKTAWQIFTSHPIIGTGLDTFAFAYTRYDTMNGFLRVEQAHNDYLQALADGGILAFAAVVTFVYFLFRNGLRTITATEDSLDRGIAIGALAGCAGILTHSFFDFPLRTPANALFFLILAALAANFVPREKSRHRRG